LASLGRFKIHTRSKLHSLFKRRKKPALKQVELVSVKYSVGHLIAYTRFVKTEIILAKAVSERKMEI
jgi:hypothetical protein